ncbi:MAG: putative repeat protein (TIGR01451 family), partial [Myxococcota bacterium]
MTIRTLAATIALLSLTGCDDLTGTTSTDDSTTATAECACDAAITKRPASDFVGGEVGYWEVLVDWQGAEYCGQEQLCVVDALPAGQSFSNNSADWDCTDSGGEVTCCATDFDPAASFSSHTLELEVDISSDVSAGSVENCAKLDIIDAVADNNSSCATAEVSEAPLTVDLSITKGIEGTPVGDDMGHFYFSVANNGTGPATSVVITDTLPEGMTFDDQSIGDWYCDGDDLSPETVTCKLLSTLAAGGSDTLVLPVNVAMPNEEQIAGTNCAEISSDEVDLNPEDNASCVDYEIEVPAELCGNCLDDDGDGEIDEDCEFELEVLFSADDEMELFVDGASQGTYLGWSTSDTVTMTLTSGTHHIAAHAYDLGGSITGFRAQISLDSSVLAQTGDGSFLGSNTFPGTGWETSTVGLSAGANLCSYSSGWNVGPADLESAGTDWIWFSDTSTGC